MLEAANRRLERRRDQLEKQRKLAAEGAVTERSLGAFQEEMERAREEVALAESRAQVCRDLTVIAQAEKDLE